MKGAPALSTDPGAGRSRGRAGEASAPGRRPTGRGRPTRRSRLAVFAALGGGGGALLAALLVLVHAASFGGCTLEVEGGLRVQCADASGCDDQNECTVDTCQPDGLCLWEAIPDGPIARQEPADCKVNLCVGGVVQENAFDPTDIFDDSNTCTNDVCDTVTWEPVNYPLPFETSCDDGAGHNGVCGCVVGGELVECPAGGTILCQIPCTADTAPTVCADAYFCTEDGFCDTVSGFCTYPLRSGEPLPEDQQTPNDCRLLVCDDDTAGEVPADDNTDLPLPDDNPCTDNVCEAGTPYQLGNSAPCDNGVYCDGDDTCVPRADPHEGGSCDYHPGDPCAGNVGGLDSNCSESCSEASDNCTAPDPDGSTCSDGVYCNGGESCWGGSCGASAGNPCPGHNVGNTCNDSCNEGADNCTANDANGTTCNDGTYCNGADTCSDGTCAHAGNPCDPTPSDADCTGACNETSDNCTGPEPNGSACNDGLYCNGTDTCNAGNCSNHASAPTCPGPDGDDDCSESCKELGSGTGDCTGNDANGAACNDGDYCNGPELCGAGSCVNTGTPIVCPGPDGDSNCSESCLDLGNGTGNCTGPDDDAAACNDGQYCNGTDACANGTCGLHSGDPCPGPDGDSDCSETCNENNDNCTANDANGTSCDDGDYCNGTDSCSAGACSAHANPPCVPYTDEDCAGGCDGTNRDCSDPEPAGSPCVQGSHTACDATGSCTGP